MINFIKKLFTNTEHGIPYSKGGTYGLRIIDTDKISLDEYVYRKTGDLSGQNPCADCNREQYLHNYGYAQFCKKDAPTLIMNCSAEEYKREHGISIDQIKSENANINIKFNL